MLNFVFPKLCLSCNSSAKDIPICDSCYSSINFLNQNHCCSTCGIPFGTNETDQYTDHFCSRCIAGEFYFIKARSVAYFEGLLRDLLHGFKYRRKLHLGNILSHVFSSNLPGDLNSFDIVLPVPVHLNKLREREYNQSAIFGKKLSETYTSEFDPFVLYKTEDTPPQVSFESIQNRKKNVRNFFSVRNVNRIKNRSVLLVDDVYTTGSTVNECSKVLLHAGAASVQVLTLMRAN